jgi:hypothetical protein
MHRSEYMAMREPEDQARAHRAYYSQYVTEEIKQRLLRRILLAELLNSTDQYLNDIRLGRWDAIVRNLPRTTVQQLRENGDWLSLGTGVCILKEAARQIIEEGQQKESHDDLESLTTDQS